MARRSQTSESIAVLPRTDLEELAGVEPDGEDE